MRATGVAVGTLIALGSAPVLSAGGGHLDGGRLDPLGVLAALGAARLVGGLTVLAAGPAQRTPDRVQAVRIPPKA